MAVKPGDIDWSMLRGALVLLVIALAIGGGLVYGGHHIASEAELVQRRGQGSFQAARARYLTLDEERRLIETFAPRYAALEDEGLIGEERRLSWVETLRAVARGMKMPALRYEISSQDTFEPDFPVPQGSYSVFATDMRLRMGLLHEADLPAVLTALAQGARGLFSVRDCSMVRRDGAFGGAPDPREPNLDVDCRLQWFVVRRPESGA